jgi:hypothetical protein
MPTFISRARDFFLRAKDRAYDRDTTTTVLGSVIKINDSDTLLINATDKLLIGELGKSILLKAEPRDTYLLAKDIDG